MENSIAKIKITKLNQLGTCYFLSKSIVATCYHVIAGVYEFAKDPLELGSIEPNSCVIDFYETYENENGEKSIEPHENLAIRRLLDIDMENDIALLELEEEVEKAEPVSLLRHNSNLSNVEWYSRGFPVINENGISLSGKIQSLVTLDVNNQQRMELKAEQIEDNELGGISGSPVFVNGKVVGHLTSNAINRDNKNIFGIVYAVSGGYIRRLADSFVSGLDDDLGMVIFDGEIYIKRGVEALISDKLLKGNVCLTGYLMSGKTRTITYFQKFEKDGIFLDIPPQNIRSVKIDFYNIKSNPASDEETLLKFFCDSIVRELNTTEESFYPPDLNGPGTKPEIASDWFRETLLTHFSDKGIRFLIYIDNGEVILEKFKDVSDSFFAMLRGWTSDKDSTGIFGILMSFTDTFFLKDIERPAVFNASISPELKDFNAEEIRIFAKRYCLANKLSDGDLKDKQVIDIIKWTSGNPCLVRLLFEGILMEKQRQRSNFNFDTAFRKVIMDRTTFRHYLDTLEDSLRRGGLTNEMRLYKFDYDYLDEEKSNYDDRRKLIKSGIVVEQLNDNGSSMYKLRCAHFRF